MISTRPFRFAMITGMSPQNSQINWRQAPAGRREGIGVSDDGNSIEPASAFADGFENGDALGANGEAVG